MSGMTLTIKSMANSAFDGCVREETARILEDLAEKIRGYGADCGDLRDLNGNNVGVWSADFPEVRDCESCHEPLSEDHFPSLCNDCLQEEE